MSMKRNIQPADHTDSPRPPKSRRILNQFGLKELAPGINPDVDIVAIHGIDGDREDSWTADNAVLWLRDLLPAKIPNARILTYGYDANTHGHDQLATEFMHEHALNFVSKLALSREETATVDRAIIFVAHGAGGLLLKYALLHSNLCHDSHLKNHRAISRSTHGVTFFGTPHLGSATSELAQSIFNMGSLSTPTSNVLLQHLERDSEVLQHLLVQYSAISGQFETKFFYETYDTCVAGVPKRVVPRSSAVVPGVVNADAIGLYKDHVHMVKFPSADDEDFKIVSTTLSLMAKVAYQEKKDGCKSAIEEISLTPSQQSALSNFQHVNAARFAADSRPRCLEGTRVALLETISEWIGQDISTEHRQIFWLCGQAGMGKTTISLTVASDCEINGRLGASFFFSRDNADQSNLQLVFPTLAQQLGAFHPPFKKSLATVLERDPALGQMEPMFQFRKLIVEPLKSCESFPTPTIIVIDALDECKDENPISRMISILSAHIHELPSLKFFVTSRPENHIICGFRRLSTSAQSVILHEIEASVVDADIELYLRDGLSTAAQLYSDLVKPDWPSDEFIKSLVRKSGRLFIFAATAMTFIRDPNYSNPPSQLAILLEQSSAVGPSSPFGLLDQLYLQVLRQAFPSGTTPLHRLNLLRNILGAIVLLRDPLSPGALENLLGLGSGTVRTTLRHMHSVIFVPDMDEHPIRLIHPSFFDFITTRCSDVDFRIDSPLCHEQLAIGCFKQMNGLKRNICEIPDASKLHCEIEDLDERIDQYISPEMQYACFHWSFHLCIAGGDTLQGMLREFCFGKILYWIEALSLLDDLQNGIRDLQHLLKSLNVWSTPRLSSKILKVPQIFSTPSEDLLDALRDSTRFMATHCELISNESRQLYRSALPLSPPSSFLHKTFHHELRGGMRVLQGKWMEEESSDVTVLRGSTHEIISLDLSPEGTLIVSGSYYGEIRLWDRSTGTSTLLRDLGVTYQVTAARFFPDDSSRVIFVTDEGISTLAVATGDLLQTIHINQHFECCIISPDCTRIVGSEESCIYMWSTSNGDLLKTLSGHSASVFALAFSPDQMLIASASDDHTARIWDAINGTELRTLRGHSDCVRTIAFSPDSKHIISGSRDRDIRLWDVSSGGTLTILKGHTSAINSVAFSPDSTHVISSSLDRTLRSWDTIDGKLKTLKTIEVASFVCNLRFSPDGKQCISSTDASIYIWDLNQCSNSNFDEFVEWEFEEVKFSRDGTFIIGQVDDRKSLHIWDGLTGTPLISFKEDQATLSPNEKYFACKPVNGDDNLWLWEIASRTIIWKTQAEGASRIRYIKFSSDSTRIISSSVSAVRIWDVASGNNLYAFYPILFTGSHFTVDFSRDGSQIIMTPTHQYNIPPHARPHPVPSMDEPFEQLNYSIVDDWIGVSNGFEKELCVWIPYDWTWRSFQVENPYSSSHDRVAIGTTHGLVLLDLSGIRLSICKPQGSQ